MINGIMLIKKNQVEILSDKKNNGKERPWKEKKMNNEYLQASYKRIGYENKALRVSWCGTYLNFKVLEDGSMRLSSANFCQIPLCPMCAWRRELKILAQLSKVVGKIEQDGYRFIFLTLTCENVYGNNLNNTLDNLLAAFRRLFELKQVRKSIKGFFRALEITHDMDEKITKNMYKDKRRSKYYRSKSLKVGDLNPNYNKYHPHLHIMLVVNKSYFNDNNCYITQSEWTNMWQQSLRVDYIPIVNIQAVRNKDNKGVKEVAKYSVKYTDYLVKEDKQLTDETVRILDGALHHRRLVAYGGLMKEVHKSLNLANDITADVVIGGENEMINISNTIKVYKWHIGFKNYVLQKIVKIE